MDYYILNNNGFEDNGFAHAEEKGKINTGNAAKCAECGSFLTMLEWLPPYEVKLSGGKLPEVIFGTITHFLASEKFKKIYDENGFKGIVSFRPVRLFQNGQELGKYYYHPKITLSKAQIDIEKSGIVFDGEGKCLTCQKAGRVIKKIKGLHFNNVDSITEDVFCTMMLPGSVVFSKRFKEAVSELTNVSFVKVEEYIPDWVL